MRRKHVQEFQILKLLDKNFRIMVVSMFIKLNEREYQELIENYIKSGNSRTEK